MSLRWVALVMVMLGLCGCAVWGLIRGRPSEQEDIRAMDFKMGELEVKIKYQDPSVVDLRLKDSRILPFHFSTKNHSEQAIPFNQRDIKLNVGIPQLLEPIAVDAVLEEMRRVKRVPTFFIKVLKIISSQSSAFHPTNWQRLAQELRKRSLRDGNIEPGETREGLVFFKHPQEPLDLDWANLEFSLYPPQAIETKGYKVYPGGKQESFLTRFTKLWQRYITGSAPPFNKSYALLIGIGNYRHLPSLSSPAQDVEKMKDFLIKQGFDEIIYVTDEDVEVSKLQSPQSYFNVKIQQEDRFLFYYSGHGRTKILQNIEKRGYLPLVNEKPGRYDHSIPMDNLVSWMDTLEANHLLVVLDCCFSGLAVRGVETKADEPDYDPQINPKVLRKLSTMPARYLLMAGTEDQVSIADRQWNGSLFTDAIIEGLKKGADRYNDGIITVRELYVWLRPVVAIEAAKVNKELYPLLKDLGEYGISEGEFFFLRK